MTAPTDLASLVAFLKEQPRLFCEHPLPEESGERLVTHYNDGLLWYTTEQGTKGYIPLGCARSITYTAHGFTVTVFTKAVRYYYMGEDKPGDTLTLSLPMLAAWERTVEASLTPGQIMRAEREDYERRTGK